MLTVPPLWIRPPALESAREYTKICRWTRFQADLQPFVTAGLRVLVENDTNGALSLDA